MLALFAVGVVTGTILSFEIGLLWPNFMASVRRRLRARLRARGLLVLRRGDLHRDLRVRLGPAVAAAALPLRHPDRDRRVHRLADRHRRQRLDEPSHRLHAAGRAGRRRRTRGRRCSATATSGTSSCTCTSPATSSPGSCVAGAYAWGSLRGRRGPLRADRAGDRRSTRRRARRAGAGRRRRLGGARRGARRSRSSSRRSRGSATTTRGAPDAPARLVRRQRGRVRDRDPEAALAARLPRPERARSRASTPSRRPTGRR